MLNPLMAQECNSCTLIGDNYITLNSDVKNYSTQETFGARFFWSVTGGLSIQGSNRGASINIIALSQSPSKLCITRYEDRKEPCTNCKEIKIIESGDCRLFGAAIEPFGISVRCSGIGFKVFTNLGEERDCGLNYRWFVDDGEIVSGQGTSTIIIDTDISNPKVGVKVGTCCGFYRIASLNASCDLCNQVEPCFE